MLLGGFRILQLLLEAGDDRTPFAITDAETGEVIGSIDMSINRLQTGHIGYWLAAESRGRGLTTAALRALSRWAIEERGLLGVGLQREVLQREVPADFRSPQAANSGFSRACRACPISPIPR